MSKIKENLLRQQELQQEYCYKFMDFVYDNLVSTKLDEIEINNMERSQLKPLTDQDVIVSKEPLNNENYKPNKENSYAN